MSSRGVAVKTRLAGGEVLLGTLLRMPAEELLEMTAVSGFDFVLIDGEHGPLDLVALRAHIALADARGMAVLVRTGHAEPAAVLRVLDAGAQGVVAPHVDTEAEARELVAAAHYPPLGQRGFATYGRRGRFGQVSASEHLAAATRETLVIAMIESPLGVANAAGIVGVPGLDGVMVGPADLRASSTPDDPDPVAAMATVHVELARAGLARMDIVLDTAQARRARDDGAQLVVYNLTATLMGHLSELRSAM